MDPVVSQSPSHIWHPPQFLGLLCYHGSPTVPASSSCRVQGILYPVNLSYHGESQPIPIATWLSDRSWSGGGEKQEGTLSTPPRPNSKGHTQWVLQISPMSEIYQWLISHSSFQFSVSSFPEVRWILCFLSPLQAKLSWWGLYGSVSSHGLQVPRNLAQENVMLAAWELPVWSCLLLCVCTVFPASWSVLL